MSGSTFGRNMLLAASIIVLATLAMALYVMDGPAKQRDRRLDERRVQDLNAISDAIDEAATTTGRMPRSLHALASEPGASLAIVDPVDGIPYVFKPTSDVGYTLCAVFATSTSDRNPEVRGVGWYEREWRHPSGQHCFNRRLSDAARSVVSEAGAKPAKPTMP